MGTRTRSDLLSLLAGTSPLAGTLAESFLRGKELSAPWPHALRFHPAVWQESTQSHTPALVAHLSVTWEPDRIAGAAALHLAGGQVSGATWFGRNLTRKAIVVAPFGDEMIVALGIPTAIRATRALGIGGVAALGTRSIGNVTVPRAVRRVIFVTDADAGEDHGARRLQQRMASRGIACERVRPAHRAPRISLVA